MMKGLFIVANKKYILGGETVASEVILKQKQGIIDEIKKRVEDSTTVVLFDYRGLTDSEIKELRRKLRESGSDYKVYKNTLMNRAFDDLKIDMSEELNGPSAFAYSEDQVAPIKVLSEFAKTHDALTLKVGIIDGEKADKNKLAEYATLPSREDLLTMLAGGMIGIVRDLSIALNLYAEQKEDTSETEKVEVKEEVVEEKTTEDATESETAEAVSVEEAEKAEEKEEVVEEQVEESAQEEQKEEEPQEENIDAEEAKEE